MEQSAQVASSSLDEGQIGRGFEQPALVKDVLVHGRWVGMDDLKGPFQPKSFCGSHVL